MKERESINEEYNEKQTDIQEAEFGMGSVGEVKKFKPNKVKEVEDLGNVVSID